MPAKDIYIAVHGGRVINVGDDLNDELEAWEAVLDPASMDHKYTFEWWRSDVHGNYHKFASIQNDATEFVQSLSPQHRRALWNCRSRGFSGLPHTEFEFEPGHSWEELDAREKRLTELWPTNNILRRILKGETSVNLQVASAVDLQKLLDLQEITDMTCNGGNSGANYSFHCEEILNKDVIRDTWSVRERPPACIRGLEDTQVVDAFVTVVLGRYARSTASLDVANIDCFNLVFVINGRWRIQVKFDMINGAPPTDSSVHVRVSDVYVTSD